MSQSITVYVGLDVHKDSIDMATADAGRDAEVRHVGSLGGDLASLDRALRKLISRGHALHVVYEAGPCGFVVWRHLRAQGLACEVVAPSSIPKRSGDRVKTDRRDAIMLARLARAGELTPVRVTLPAELRSLAWQHQRVVYALLMQCAWDTLATFSRNDRQLRATPGAVGVLHTHNRRLDFHPHVHMVMPAAALDTKRKLWRTKTRRARSRRGKAGTGQQSAATTAAAAGGGGGGGGYLFNHKALAKVFRAKVLDAIERAGLTLPAQLPASWVVDCKAVGDGQKALLYLGRYLYRGVIQERDIVRCEDGQVSFRYRDAKTGKMAVRTLAGAAFLWLVLQHVLPKGLRRARNFGFLHPNSARAVRLLQLLHLRAAPAALASSAPTRPAWRCGCGQPMRVVCRRMPPLQDDAAGPGQPSRVVRPDKPDRAQARTMH